MRHPSLMSLSHDHRHGLALALRCRKQALGQIKPMGPSGLRERSDEVQDFFRSNLERHFRAEEEVLFPLLQSLVPESSSMVQELLEEHRGIRAGVQCLREGKDLAKTLFNLGDLLERHIRREERQIFSLFENHVPPGEAESVKPKIERILCRQET